MNSVRKLGAGLGAAMAVFFALFAPAASATDIGDLRDRAQNAADEVTRFEEQLRDLEEKRERIAAEIDAATQELGTLELSLDDASDALTAAHDRIVERAIEAYKSGGPSSQIALLLSTESIADLQDVAEITDEAMSIDAADIDALTAQRDELQDSQDKVDERKQELMALEETAAVVETDIEASLKDRRAELASLTTEIEQLEEKARQEAEAAAAAANIPVGEALLDILTGSGPAPGIPDGFASTGVSFAGLASWYGPGFEGNLTASGDVFDSRLYTAASKELPLGTWLYVSYEGRGVVVYVNDRGPYVGERILDLSRAAAAAIGLEGAGVGWVEAEILLKT